MPIGVAVALIGVGVGLILFTFWSRRGKTPRARWWVGRDNALLEMLALVFVPGLGGGLLSVGLMGLGLAVDNDLVHGLGLLTFICLLGWMIAALGMSRHTRRINAWVIPRWARVRGRTHTWSDRPSHSDDEYLAAPRPAKVPDATRQWTELTRRLGATLLALQPPRVGRLSLTMHGRQGALVKIVLTRRQLTAELPGTPYTTANTDVAALNARLRLEGWAPIDEWTWQFTGSHRHPHALARAAMRALRMQDATIAPPMIGYTAERDNLVTQTPMELPTLKQPRARPMLRDSHRADEPAALSPDQAPQEHD
ncbi:MAG: hypothetical protein ACOX61_01255 [Brooklawnia sp.]|jgi:hypothetical protein